MSFIPNRDDEGAYNKSNIKEPMDAEYLRGFEYALECLTNFKESEYSVAPESETLLERLKREIGEEVLNEAIDNLDGWADEVNVTILENQSEEEK